MTKRARAGYLRPAPDGYVGTAYDLDGESADIVEAPTLEAAKARMKERAVALAWSPPFRWDEPDPSDDDGVHTLTAGDTRQEA